MNKRLFAEFMTGELFIFVTDLIISSVAIYISVDSISYTLGICRKSRVAIFRITSM